MALEDDFSFIQRTFAHSYVSIYYLNLLSRKIRLLKMPERFANCLDSSCTIPQLFDFLILQVVEEQREDARRFLDLSTIEERMKGCSCLSYMCHAVGGILTEVELLPAEYGVRGDLQGLFLTSRLVSGISQEDSFEHKSLLQQLHVVQALSSDYFNVFLLYPEMGLVKVIRLDGYVTHGLNTIEERLFSYEQSVQNYMNARVYPDDIPNFQATLEISHLQELMHDREVYEYDYRVLEDGEIHYCQARIKKVPGSDQIILAFRNIDHKVLRDQQLQRTKEEARQSNILSQITKQLYSYHVTIDLESEHYSVVEGLGMPQTRALLSSHYFYSDALAVLLKYVCPDFRKQLFDLASIENLRAHQHETGFVGSLQVPFHFPGMDYDEWHEINVFINVNEQGLPMANILGRDITEAHEKEVTRQQFELANAANEAKTAFLFNMSHEIRTPMNAIVGFTELLARHQDDPERRQDYLDKIRESSSTLLSLINNVLEMARIEKGKIVLEHLPWSIEQFTDSIFSVFHDMMQQKGITFTSHVSVKHSFIYCDPTKLREVFLNIISNAYKYTNEGGSVHINLEEIGADNQGRILYCISVADTGIGMSPEFLPHLFDSFSREHTTTESQIEGTGLGMQIVKRLVDLMNGTIEVESAIGKGSTFTIVLPFFPANRTDLSIRDEKDATQVSYDFKGRRLLLAEDNDLNAEIAMEILSEAGLVVERAVDGQDCVDKLLVAQPHYYDAILMDVQMPRMNGYEATRKIRHFRDPEMSQIPILAMTANAFQEDRIAAFKAGMNGHLSKPIDINILMETLQEVLSVQ